MGRLRKVKNFLSFEHRRARREVVKELLEHGVSFRLSDLLSIDAQDLRKLSTRLRDLREDPNRGGSGVKLGDLGIDNLNSVREFLLDDEKYGALTTRLFYLKSIYGRDLGELLRGPEDVRRRVLDEGGFIAMSHSLDLGRKGEVLDRLRRVGGIAVNGRWYESPEEVLGRGEDPKVVREALRRTLLGVSISDAFRKYELSKFSDLRSGRLRLDGVQLNLQNPRRLAEKLSVLSSEEVKKVVKEINERLKVIRAQQQLRNLNILEVRTPEGRRIDVNDLDGLLALHREKDIEKIVHAYKTALRLMRQTHVSAFEGGTHILKNGMEIDLDLHGIASHVLQGGSENHFLETFRDYSSVVDAVSEAIEEARRRAGVNVEVLKAEPERLVKAALTSHHLEMSGQNLINELERAIDKYKKDLHNLRRGSSAWARALREVLKNSQNPDDTARYLKEGLKYLTLEELFSLARTLNRVASCREGRCTGRRVRKFTKKVKEVFGYRGSHEDFYNRFGIYHDVLDEFRQELANHLVEKHPELARARSAWETHKTGVEKLRELLDRHYGMKIKKAQPG